jgi:UDP-GlcNAc:undecaprenyl-phosphate GlcNAc-1-phosphate transferase
MLNALPEAAQYAGAWVLAAAITAFAVRPIRALAVRTNFYDLPVGYKQHAEPTPYLGGAAVMAGCVIATAAFASGSVKLGVTVACSVGLWAVGTVDDRIGLEIVPRIGAQAAAGVAIWAAGAGWDVGQPSADLALTTLWVIGVTNAFNLMDNLDGAAATVGMASAVGAGGISVAAGETGFAVLAFGLAGACAGFLPYNFSTQSKLFLGDGGSLPTGFVIAAVAMACSPGSLGFAAVLAVVPLAALPLFDTALVVVSRYRRGATLLSGARDHLTHRLNSRLQSPSRVALLLGTAQLLLCLLAGELRGLGRPDVIVASFGYLACAIVVLAFLESPLSPYVKSVEGNQPDLI